MGSGTESFRVLLVDDDARILESLPRLIESWGPYTVVGRMPAADGLAQAAVRLRPDIVVLDIDMPGRSPFHAMEDLRYRAHPARVLILSALGDAPTVRACFTAGAAGYVLKMDAPEDLRRGIEAVLGGRRFVSARLSELPL